MQNCVAIIVAAGRGHRIGGELPKQYLSVAGLPLLRRTVEIFITHDSISAVRVVIHPDDRELYDAAVDELDLLEPIEGGATRQESVFNGLKSLQADAPDKVLIHDAARPFTSAETIDAVLAALETNDGAIPALPVADTLKREQNAGLVGETVDRSGLWRAHTPQGFKFDKILAAHAAVAGQELTDDAAVGEKAGLKVALVGSSEENFKITTTEDVIRAEKKIMESNVRTGFGLDVHRFEDGDHVIICGIKIEHEQALAGHSDADVGLHALTDALLGAIGAGDIGTYFPPSDPQWRDVDSEVFLAKARDLVLEKGGYINNVDLTIVCEAPKIGPHRDAMTENVARILQIPEGHVGIKATTTETLGFTGRKEGIAAQAVATVTI